MSIVHARIDYRLIHGQVITKWLKRSDANKIIVIDDPCHAILSWLKSIRWQRQVVLKS